MKKKAVKKAETITDLIPDDRNYNKGNEKGRELIKKSISKLGAGRSILIDKNNRIIAGNKTVENAIASGLIELQIVETTGNKIIAVKRTDIDLDSKKGRELALADNATAKANIEWDAEALNEDWSKEELSDWGVVTGFEIEAEAEEDDYEIPDTIETDIVLGDLFEIGRHRLLCGDSTDSDAVERLMDGKKADMVFTDPPYRMEAQGGINQPIGRAAAKLGKTIEHLCEFNPVAFLNTLPVVFESKKMNAYIFCNKDLVPDYLQWSLESGYSFNILFWKKPNAIPLGEQHRPDVEYLLFFRKSAIWNNAVNGVQYSKCLEFGRDNSTSHPTMKPIGLIANEIQISSTNKGVVFDFFLGSGSTMVAAHQLNRICYGMELDEKYCAVIIDRMLKLDPTLEIKRNGKPYKTTN